MSDDPFQGGTTEEPAFLSVLQHAVDALDAEKIPAVVMGGVASAALGRPRWTHDADLFVQVDDARRALAVLADAGFQTQETNEHWIFKAVKEDVLVDVIFKVGGGFYLDDEALERSVAREFKGLQLRVLSPEDLLVTKAITHDEETPHYWYDALGLLATCDLDWEYLLHRALHGVRRVLSLLLYAQSCDLVVPDRVIRELFDKVYER